MPRFNSDGSKVTSKGPGLNKAFVNKKASFTVDSSSAGKLTAANIGIKYFARGNQAFVFDMKFASIKKVCLLFYSE